MSQVRVRFAPSPTGPLHIGGVRTALYNYLFARKHRGTMILRIEDTDLARYVPGAEEYILEALQWLGIEIDEGVNRGGPHQPYRQSERKAIYRQYAEQLVQSGFAYYAFDTEAELQALRDRLRKAGVDQQQYGIFTRHTMRNSLTLGPEKTRQLLEAGTPHVVRLKVPEGQVITLHDLIRGQVTVHSEQLDDKVLLKSDGMPTYHLANVVDDILMRITHVIRGEEWLPSAPLHVLLYRGLGWEKNMPQFAHLPLLLKPDGQGKLSKRDGDRLGIPVFPLTWTDPVTGETSQGFREAGFLPEAVVNFLALLGWNPGTEEEVFTMDELIEAFSLERISKSGAHFDVLKAQWFNQQHIRRKPVETLAGWLVKACETHGVSCPPEKAVKIATLLRERITFPQDLYAQARWYFQPPGQPDASLLQKKWSASIQQVLTDVVEQWRRIADFTAPELKKAAENAAVTRGVKPGMIMQPLRIFLTGETAGPDLMQVAETLGREECLARLTFALEYTRTFAL
jgi:glutamyl-tRNA synthetase